MIPSVLSNIHFLFKTTEGIKRKYYQLLTAQSFKNELDPTTTPKIMITNMVNVVLMLKSLGINDLHHFDFMDVPPVSTLIRELELLFALDRLNNCGEFINLRRKMRLEGKRRELDNREDCLERNEKD